MSDETKAFLYAGATLLFALFGKKLFRRRPAARSFTCHRCGLIQAHDRRTMGALRQGKTRFFCRPCHHKWLSTQPTRQQGPRPGSQAASSSGCLGIALVLVALPTFGLVTWACF